MKIKSIILVVIIVLTLGFTLSVMLINQKQIAKLDMVAVNDVVKKAGGSWGAISNELFIHSTLQQPFTITDSKGNTLYQSKNYPFHTLHESIKNKDMMIDLKHNEEVVGKLIIYNNEQEVLQQLKSELIVVLTIIFTSMLIIILIIISVLNGTILKPFQELQQFAKHVARGHFNFPLRMDKNNYFGAFTESFDLLREELEAARQREYEANRSKKELVATVSHDIKTPIASIKAVSELMLIQAKDEKLIKQVNTIYSKAEQINLLITDMFHATLEELQQLKIMITEQSSEELMTMLDKVNYDQLILYERIPQCMVLMDPVRMQQVIDNVISNSYKYASTTIKITSQLKEGYLDLLISDFGEGVSQEELPLLFNKYYRGANVEGVNGSGLGLYISKYFMENMHGQIDCYNQIDGFTVVLKIKLA